MPPRLQQSPKVWPPCGAGSTLVPPLVSSPSRLVITLRPSFSSPFWPVSIQVLWHQPTNLSQFIANFWQGSHTEYYLIISSLFSLCTLGTAIILGHGWWKTKDPDRIVPDFSSMESITPGILEFAFVNVVEMHVFICIWNLMWFCCVHPPGDFGSSV